MARTLQSEFPASYGPPAALGSAIEAAGFNAAHWGNEMSPHWRIATDDGDEPDYAVDLWYMSLSNAEARESYGYAEPFVQLDTYQCGRPEDTCYFPARCLPHYLAAMARHPEEDLWQRHAYAVLEARHHAGDLFGFDSIIQEK